MNENAPSAFMSIAVAQHPIVPPFCPMAMTEIQIILKEILQAVIHLCEDEGIEYFLIGGGCLGIIRHNNRFVPWDDDLDISIWAGDMKRFVAAAQRLPTGYTVRPAGGIQYPTYKVMDLSTRTIPVDGKDDGNGIFVDIVPMMHWKSLAWKRLDDVAGLLESTRSRQGSPVRWKRLAVGLGQRTGLSALLAPLAKVLLYPVFLSHDRACRPDRKGIVSGAIGRRWKGRYPSEVIYPLRNATLEGITVKVPHDLRRFLLLRYGPDYMQIPSPDTRWKHFDCACRTSSR
jgi:lipopolysaccharide cholinephosphotransferase